MNEADTRANLIDTALREAGWGVVAGSRLDREFIIAPGRIESPGKPRRPTIADYILYYRSQKLGVIEAKADTEPVTAGLAQAKRDATSLQARFAFSTNGVGIYRADMQTGAEGPIAAFPGPEELWGDTFAQENQWRNAFAAVPFEEKGGNWTVRYYQHNAVNNVLEAIAAGEDRILLTMATGTGKTAVAFQIAWKLFHSRWNLGRQPTRRPRILFLADRNILATQAFNAFSPFEDQMPGSCARIKPGEIRKAGRVPKNASLFFTIFQTFMSGTDASGDPAPWFGEYPPDFFDFIVIDECHRGGANDEGTWRGIMEHFAPAVQLGLTATPRRDDNVDTYEYFGDPVYVYSLKEGINDGYLTPFRVKQISTTLDEYVYTSDDDVVEGEVEVGKRYVERDFNRIIEIPTRERERVRIFLNLIDQRQKTLVFCATQDHALAVRDLINQMADSSDPSYCVRVTADDSALGEQYLRIFQDNEKTIPTILTTSQKLSTGVDARNIRNIVLMRPIYSVIEFKQIIGRGTRLYDDKFYFTILDFVKAYEHFNDPEWDGPPEEIIKDPCPKCGEQPCACEKAPPRVCLNCGERPCVCEKPPPEVCPKCGKAPCECPKRVKIKLSDGKTREIQHMVATSFWSPDGKPMSAAEFMQRMFGDIPDLFKDEAELRRLWSRPDTRRSLLDGLAEKGYGPEQLGEIARLINAEQSDIYDVLAYVAYARAPLTRAERVNQCRPILMTQYDPKQQDFLDFVLAHYIEQGVSELDQDKLPDLIDLKYHAIADAVTALGNVSQIRTVFVGFQAHLYSSPGAA